jgi:hypothetical protein
VEEQKARKATVLSNRAECYLRTGNFAKVTQRPAHHRRPPSLNVRLTVELTVEGRPLPLRITGARGLGGLARAGRHAGEDARESILRVHWVAVPKAMRARCVNRLARSWRCRSWRRSPRSRRSWPSRSVCHAYEYFNTVTSTLMMMMMMVRVMVMVMMMMMMRSAARRRACTAAAAAAAWAPLPALVWLRVVVAHDCIITSPQRRVEAEAAKQAEADAAQAEHR